MDFDERARRIENRRIHQISRVKTNPKAPARTIEQEHRVVKLLKWLPKGEGRKQDLVQFVALHGGIRTVPAADLIVL